MSTFIGESLLNLFGIFFVFIILIAQIICYHYDWKPRIAQMPADQGQKRTYITIILIISTLIFNLITLSFQLSIHYAFPSCGICSSGYIINRLFFVSIRCLNRLFFIQRAKLSQEIKPILADKWFDRVLPLTVLTLYAVFVISIISINIFGNDYNDVECIDTQHDDRTHKQCINHTLGANGAQDLIYIATSTVAIIINIIIVFLFLKPICLIPSMSNDMFSNSKFCSFIFIFVSSSIFIDIDKNM